MHVVKAATSAHVRGPQIIRIQPETGVEVHPSLIAYYGLLRQAHRKQRIDDTSRGDGAPPLCFGHADLDKVLTERFGASDCCGAIQAGSCNLLIGESSTYKTPLALHFAGQAVMDGGKAIFLSFHDHVLTLREFMNRMGLVQTLHTFLEDKGSIEKGSKPSWLYERRFPDPVRCDDVNENDITKPRHKFILQQMTSWFTPPEVFMSMLKALFERMGIELNGGHKCRIVFDAVSDLNMSYPRLTGRRGFLAVLVNTLRVYGLTSLFVFNEGPVESSQDKVIVSLADNIFHMRRRSVADKSSTILHVEQLGNRLPRYTGVMQVRREHDGLHADERIVIKESLEAYRLDQNKEFVPAAIKLYVNRRAASHEVFNEAICRAHRLSKAQLDQDLAIQRGEAYRQNLENLRANEDSSVIMAIDEDCLCNENLEKFVPLRDEQNKSDDDFFGVGTKENGYEFCNLSACRLKPKTPSSREQQDNRIWVLPSLIDCTVLTCNVRILNDLSSAETKSLRILEDIIRGASDQIDQNAGKWEGRDEHSLWGSLPVIPWQLLREAAVEFYRAIGDRSYRFLSFATSEELEALVVLFVDLLHRKGIIRTSEELANSPLGVIDEERIDEGEIEFIAGILEDASRLYLGDSPYCSKGEETADNCLFYYTWHSILYSGSQQRLVPLRIVSVEDWEKRKGELVPGSTGIKSCFEILRRTADKLDDQSSKAGQAVWSFTRGGYYWGILDNGLAGERVREVLKYAMNDAMNLFRIKARVGMPPRKKFYVNTGEMSIYNLRLMRDVFEKGWSRTQYPNYHSTASYIRAFLSEYLDYLHRRKPTNKDSEELRRWLRNFLREVLRQVRSENLR